MAESYRSFSDFVNFCARAAEIAEDRAYRYARAPRPVLRDRQNPMDIYNDAEFLSRYRFSKQAVLELLGRLPLRANTDERGLPVPPLLQLLVALRFYGAGTFQIVTGDLVNVSQPTVSRIIARISHMIAETLFAELVKFPSAAEAPGVMEEFYAVAKFPGVTGCIDCTHIPIKSPGGNDAEVFRNRKGYFSINVQAITGPKLQFLDLVASWPGSAHDSRIFDNSRARVQYEQGDIPGILLGDMGYACRPYLMTPLRDDVLPGSPQYKYNKSQIRTRCSIERTFGVWKRRFPCLDMTLQIKTATVPIVITACAALHNLGRLLKDPVPPALLYDATRDCTAPVPVSRAAQPPATVPLVDSASGFRTRDRIIAQYFH
ncbi:hypothetical protein V5799_006354 [Amblyomma americanum]|uniref:DDE Tnp4 domain-containing protein n=1 Tax=Amblyomma americanum TaxID=6943 RepID=A0AAQ4DWM3_AMBAM